MLENEGRRSWVSIALAAAVLLVLGIALAFRVIDLGNLPGVNGDEAYYGITMLKMRDGERPPLRTNSGLFLSPFYSGPLFVLHLFWWPPSFIVMRLPALLSVLLAVGLTYPLLSRVFDGRTALYTMLLLACLPITIAYSRLGWDQSQAPLVSLLCLFFALRHQVRLAFVSFLVALVVHPLNLFLLPIMLGPAGAAEIYKFVDAPADERRRLVRKLLPRLGIVVLIGAAVGVALVARAWTTGSIGRDILGGAAARLVSIPGWLDFAMSYGELLSGTTIFHYVAGPMPSGTVERERFLFWGVVLLLLLGGLPRLIRRRDQVALGLLGGLGISLAGCYLLLGPVPLSPGRERYAMWLITPSCLVLALLVRSLGDGEWEGHLQLGGVLLISGLLLTSFYENYYQVFRQTGGESHRAFRTGTIEPKQAAYAYMVETAGTDEPFVVLAEDYWSCFPIRYLARRHRGTRVLDCSNPFDTRDLGPPQRRFAVGFAEGPYDRLLGSKLPRQEFRDYSGRPVLYVWDLGDDSQLLPGLIAAAQAPPKEP